VENGMKVWTFDMKVDDITSDFAHDVFFVFESRLNLLYIL
jgi:hypothetical protein